MVRQTDAVSAFAILLATAAVGQTSPALRVAPRPVLEVVFDAPKAGIARASRSEMVRAVATSVRAGTDLSALQTSGRTLDPCFRDDTPAPLLCVLRGLRPRFEAARAAAPAADFEALWNQTPRPGDPRRSDLVLLIQYAPVLDRERVQAILLDLRAMATRYTRWMAETPVKGSDRQGRTEYEAALQEELFEVGVLSPPVAQDVRHAQDVRDFLDRILSRNYAKIFDRRGLRRFGALNLTAPPESLVFIDRAAIGGTRAARTPIRDIPPGTHRIRIEHPSYFPHEETFSIEPQQTVTLRPVMVPAPTTAVRLTRQTLMWTGVAAVATGITVLAVTAATPSTGNKCVSDGTCDPPFKELGSALGVPLGAALIGGGATWSLTALFQEDDANWPWWEFLAGLAVAGATYGIGAAANPSVDL